MTDIVLEESDLKNYRERRMAELKSQHEQQMRAKLNQTGEVVLLRASRAHFDNGLVC
jgi:hypothetical protein